MQIIITGSSGGIGSEIVARFLRQSANVIGVDRSLNHNGVGESPNFRFVHCDMADANSLQQTVNHLLETLSSIDLLVHCAGVFYDDHVARANEIAQAELWRVNYLAPALMTEALHPLLIKGETPSVIFITSADAIVASAGQDSEVGTAHDLYYASSKGALLTTTRALAMRWAKDNIRVNAICPTIIRSPMTVELLATPHKEEQLGKTIPLGRVGECADVATAVECLHKLTFTTAHALPVDGGYLCK